VNRRFVVTYAASAAAFAVAFGGAISYEWLSTEHYGLNAWIQHSLLRSIAPMASGSALLLALVLWAHGQPVERFEAELAPALKRASLFVPPVHVVASLSVLLACFGVATRMAGLTFGGVGTWLSWLGAADFVIGFIATLLDSALILVLAYRFAVRLRVVGSLPAKLVVVLTVTVPLRASLALILSSILSA
jgi:hypothetical protein